MTQKLTIPKRILFSSVCTLGFVGVLVLSGEIGLRLSPAQLPVQVFRASEQLEIHATPWGPYWMDSRDDRFRIGCPDESAPIVLLQGSSILYGSTTESEDSFSVYVQQELEALRGHPVCVLNQATPGSTFSSQYAGAQSLSDARRPAITLWEIWHNTPHHFVEVGSAVYNFGLLSTEDVPDPWGIGDAGRWLLAWSRSYEFLLLYDYKRPALKVDKWSVFLETGFPRMTDWADARDSTLLLASFPSANRPFAEQLSSEHSPYRRVRQRARDEDIAMLDVTGVLEDRRDVYFADSCCHYTVEGTRAVSRILARFIHEQWPGNGTSRP